MKRSKKKINHIENPPPLQMMQLLIVIYLYLNLALALAKVKERSPKNSIKETKMNQKNMRLQSLQMMKLLMKHLYLNWGQVMNQNLIIKMILKMQVH